MQWDVVVIGSGAGGLLAAMRAADQGLSVIVLEKTEFYGGTTATSGGAIWVPCHGLDGHEDSREEAQTYLRHITRGEAHDDRIEAYLDHAPAMVAYLKESGIACDMLAGYPDYYTEAPGAHCGRALVPREIDGKELADDYAYLRPPFGAFMLLDRYALSLEQAFALSARLPGWWRVAAKMLLKYWLDLPWRLKTRRDRRATMGNALIGGMRRELKRRGVPVLLNTGIHRIVMEDGHVAGVEVTGKGAESRFDARCGVILAAGGFEQSQQLRDDNLPVATERRWSLTPPGANSGDALLAASEIGAAREFMDYFWWAPSTQLPSLKDPATLVAHQMFFDHRHPHSLVVNQLGERFVNESCSYDDFGKAMIADQLKTGANLPCWMVFDATYRAQYGCGGILPGSVMPDSSIPDNWWEGYFYRAPSITALANMIAVPVEALTRSVAEINRSAKEGRDASFARGASAYDRFFGDQSVQPNPSLGPVDKSPFYAIRIDLGDLGTKGGIKVDANARVIDLAGRPIAGLYAVGNCAASPFANSYPGSGGTIGPALTFAMIAADHLAQHAAGISGDRDSLEP
jgi:3-oxosteroid 1-dehydrogenase